VYRNRVTYWNRTAAAETLAEAARQPLRMSSVPRRRLSRFTHDDDSDRSSFGSVFDSIEDKRASLQREDAATAATTAADRASATDYFMTMASASAVASAYATRQQVQRRPAAADSSGSQQKRRKRSEQ